MRVIVLGGTRFIGRAITEVLTAAGHAVIVAHRGTQTDLLPLTEESPLRTGRHINGPAWENLDVEEAYLCAGATVLRLGAVYGEHDYQHRFEPVLRRVRAGRPRLPVGAGSFVWSRVYAGDVAEAVLAALGTRRGAGQCLNIVEEQAAPMRLHYEQVIAAADAALELVRVPDEALLRRRPGPCRRALAPGGTDPP